MAAQTQAKERPEHRPLPPPNTDFYEVTETLNAEELALLMSGWSGGRTC